MLNAIQSLVNKGHLSKISRARKQTVYLFILQDLLSSCVALSTCSAFGELNFGCTSRIYSTWDWSPLSSDKVGLVRKRGRIPWFSTLPPTFFNLFSLLKQETGLCSLFVWNLPGALYRETTELSAKPLSAALHSSWRRASNPQQVSNTAR